MNRRIAAALFAVLMLSSTFACCPTQNMRGAQLCPRVAQVSPAGKRHRAKHDEPAPPPSEAMPKPATNDYDAPWYRQRNHELADIIRRNNPLESQEQIESDIARMAIDPDKPMIALTFDDGPTPGVTDQILDVLAQYNARATFFVCGWRFEREECKTILRQIAASGCEIGNHTWSHAMIQGQNYVGVRYEIENTNDIIFETTGVRPRCFRPPGGRNSYEATCVTRENDMVIVLWSQSGNVHEYDPKRIAENVNKQIVNGRELRDGDVVLLHDTPQCMVDAVKIMVPALIKQGYQLVTVWELLNCSGVEIVPGTLYLPR